ncbi:MAG: hypothetical protein HGA97_01380 [Chlorobiaceae bacterium]|nr:hypothetical protein [Chlorobiaceae bacterium]
MLQIRRLLMLLQEVRSIREIQRFTGIHRTTIKSYSERFRNSGKSFDELLNLPDSELAALLHPPRNTKQADERYSWLSGRLEHYARELQRRHVRKFAVVSVEVQSKPRVMVYIVMSEGDFRFSRILAIANNNAQP